MHLERFSISCTCHDSIDFFVCWVGFRFVPGRKWSRVPKVLWHPSISKTKNQKFLSSLRTHIQIPKSVRIRIYSCACAFSHQPLFHFQNARSRPFPSHNDIPYILYDFHHSEIIVFFCSFGFCCLADDGGSDDTIRAVRRWNLRWIFLLSWSFCEKLKLWAVVSDFYRRKGGLYWKSFEIQILKCTMNEL